MAMVDSVFLGAGIHSSLGRGVVNNIEALQQPATPPVLLNNTATGQVIDIPYKVLAGLALENISGRLYTVVNHVIDEALQEAQLSQKQCQSMAVFIGSSSFDISVTEACYQQELHDNGSTAIPLREPSLANLADYLVRERGFRGENYSFNTACTSSANALITATAYIAAGLIDYALILAVELHNNVTALGFHNLDLLSSSVMKPFDENRDGMVLGESVSALVVGRVPNDDVRRFYLRGSASLSDTCSITATNPDGTMVTEVIKQALASAKLAAEEIDAIKVHGTASLSNDEAEAIGMQQVFSPLPTLCALKPYVGHTLGACGLSELILFYRAIEAGFLIATPGITATVGALGLSLNQERGRLSQGNFMLNYFGFGGNNTSLLISNVSQAAL